MASNDRGYFVPTDGGLAPVPEASSPWSPDMLHGRLLAGLAARAGLSFINADLTLFLARPPGSDWIGLEVADHVAADGLAIGTCTLYDLTGPIGWSSVCAVANEVMGAGS